MNWFKRKSQLPSLRKQLGAVPSSDQWRRSPAAVQNAVRVLSSDAGRNMLDILVNERPSRYTLPAGSTPEDIARYLGRIDGYEMALNKFLQLAEPIVEQQEPEITFPDEITHEDS
jgi:hypothetical protein